MDAESPDPKPVAVLGPVPSIAEQTAALLQDPRYLVQQMRRQAEDESIPPLTPEDLDAVFADDSDEDPDILTGYEVIQMDEITPPADSEGRMPEQGQGQSADAPPVDGSAEPTTAAVPEAPQPQSPATGGLTSG